MVAVIVLLIVLLILWEASARVSLTYMEFALSVVTLVSIRVVRKS